MSYFLKVKDSDFVKSYKLISDKTTVNSFRKLLVSIATVNNLDLNNVKLEFNNIEIEYYSIQTKQGLSKKTITLDELFLRGGKIFD